MGQKLSNGEDKLRSQASRNAQVTAQMRRDVSLQQQEVKLLLLGAGESGKSTLLKQMKLLYGDNSHFTPTLKQSVLHSVRNNIIQNLQHLTRAALNTFPSKPDSEEKRRSILQDLVSVQEFLSYNYVHQENPKMDQVKKTKVSKKNKAKNAFSLQAMDFPTPTEDDASTVASRDSAEASATFKKLNPRPKYSNFEQSNLRQDLGELVLDRRLINLMSQLWLDPFVQECWQNKSKIPVVQESFPSFMTKYDKVFSQYYVPDAEDWLHVRVRTVGVVEERFSIDDAKFKIVDVGGQRNERKKWLYHFSNVNAIIYVVALSEYDQVLFEDATKNRMIDSMELFQTTITNPDLEKVGWIIFFNKSDLYKEKLNKVPIRDIENELFLDFEGPYCPLGIDEEHKDFKEAHDAGIKYFQGKFQTMLREAGGKRAFFSHVTCAMDQHNVHVVFQLTKKIVLRDLMTEHGMI
eukprot:maker-scaffold_6-snap-gene-16.16-mRNA-1 protein AED:0.08 eAED:0.08 QI:473/1/1/1/1/1/2/168/462